MQEITIEITGQDILNGEPMDDKSIPSLCVGHYWPSYEEALDMLRWGQSILISNEAYMDEIFDNDLDRKLLVVSCDPSTLKRRIVWIRKENESYDDFKPFLETFDERCAAF